MYLNLGRSHLGPGHSENLGQQLMREREEPQKLDVRHHGPQVVVVGGNGRVLNVVVACQVVKL